MEKKKTNILFKVFFLMFAFNILIIQNGYTKTAVPSRNILSEFKAVDSEKSIIGRIFFNYQVQYVWSYPNVKSNIIFIYVRPIGLVGASKKGKAKFNLPESISPQKDFSGIIDKIEYEGTMFDGGFIIIRLKGNYEYSVHQGDKFESIAVIIHKNIPEGSINSEELELIDESK